jgi:acetyl-CoA synthase
MPKELKDEVAPKLNKTAQALYGIDNFSNAICDETISIEPDGVSAFMKSNDHPAAKMAVLL